MNILDVVGIERFLKGEFNYSKEHSGEISYNSKVEDLFEYFLRKIISEKERNLFKKKEVNFDRMAFLDVKRRSKKENKKKMSE